MKKLFFIPCILSVVAFAPVKENLLFNTSLVVTVRNEAGNTVAGAVVQLYKEEEDYLKEVNAFRMGITNEKGVVKLKALEEVSYFILARKDDSDNAGGGERVGKLKKNRVNKITVVIQ